jgi:hypothetical protein
VVAIGRSLLFIIWHTLAERGVRYTDRGSDFYEPGSAPNAASATSDAVGGDHTLNVGLIVTNPAGNQNWCICRSEGSGLGLAIAWENARLHGGHIHAGNHPDGGAVFIVSLPLNVPRSR